MDDNCIPKPIGDDVLPPPVLSERQNEICSRLDNLCLFHGLKVRPSDMFRGAIFLMRSKCGNNPDWMSQAAHSLRETLYPIYSDHVKSITGSKTKALQKYGAVRAEERWMNRLGSVYGRLEGVTHHGNVEKNHIIFESFSEKDFRKLLDEYEEVVLPILARQIDIHSEIDELMLAGTATLDSKRISDLLEINFDSREYFFSKANECYTDWLMNNGFFDVLKKRADDPTTYSYSMPELNYLSRMAEKVPEKVADIILSVPISAETFNPEVIDRFLRITLELPADQMIRIVPKILKEDWIRLIGNFNQWGYEYRDMMKVLEEAKRYDTLLQCAKVVLSVRSDEDRDKNDSGNPFYLQHLSETGVFKFLVDIPDEFADEAFALLLRTTDSVIRFGNKKNDSKLFPIGEYYLFYGTDPISISEADLEERSYHGDKSGVLVATVLLIRRMIGDMCDEKKARSVLAKIDELVCSGSQIVHQLRYFVYLMCSDIFRTEITLAVSEVLDPEKAEELLQLTEYELLLQKGLGSFSEDCKKQFIERAFSVFEPEGKEGKGAHVFSLIRPYLSDEEAKRADSIFGRLIPFYDPLASSRGDMKVRWAIEQPPGTDEEWSDTVPKLVERLKADWSPKRIREEYSGKETFEDEEYLYEVSYEGAAKRIREEMEKRRREFLMHAESFFDRANLSPHYTHAFLTGLRDLTKKEAFSQEEAEHVLNLLVLIVDSGNKDPFETERVERKGRGWISDWVAVHYVMGDALKGVLGNEKNSVLVDNARLRDGVLKVVRYLFKYPNPTPESEEQHYTPKEKGYTGNDPFSEAINSVRGRAFESLVLFVYRDGERLKRGAEEKKIEEDVKQIFEVLLKSERTQAIRFLLGHHLASFYYRDIEWVRGLFPMIFSEDESEFPLFVAAWEGYLAQNLFQEIFDEEYIRSAYARIIRLSPEEYPKRRYFRDLDEGLATHLALAFIHYDEFTSEDDLFVSFWNIRNEKRHGEFISFIGRGCVSNEQRNGMISEKGLCEKLNGFWEWALKDDHFTSEELSGFGFWIGKTPDILGDDVWLAGMIRRTLELSEGKMEWEYGLMERLPDFVRVAPKDTLSILRLYLMRDEEDRRWISIGDKLVGVFKMLWDDAETKSETRSLINDLITKYGSLYWKLEEKVLKGE